MGVLFAEQMDKETLDKACKRLEYLYTMEKNKYITMTKYGYRTHIYSYTHKHLNEKNSRPLLPFRYEYHLKRRTTLGVFSGMLCSKFISFDLDFRENKIALLDAAKKLRKTLSELGIKNVYFSSSGNKGFHAEIFFRIPIPNATVRKLFDLIVNKSGLNDLSGGEVEFRPTPTQAVKLPLGKNFKNPNSETNICWFLDDDFNPIKDINFIYKIKQTPEGIIFDILKDAENKRYYEQSKGIKQKIRTTENAIAGRKDLDIYSDRSDIGKALKNVERLLENGLPRKGVRHKSLFLLGTYYIDYENMTTEETREKLVDFMANQSKETYSSSWEEVIKDIDGIINSIEKKGYRFVLAGRDITISDAEVRKVLNIKTKNQKLLYFSLLVHSKRYGTNKGFYMTFEQMAEATGLHKMTCFKIINKLSEAGHIQILSRNESYGDGCRKKPNRYKIEIEEPGGKTITITKEKNDMEKILKDSLKIIPAVERRKKLGKKDFAYYTEEDLKKDPTLPF
ncbi:MAG: TOTE conflict system archaeo-eukaryotic primase domain-containing protein [Dethiobacteria bacterium]